jgi:hypothetical protein
MILPCKEAAIAEILAWTEHSGDLHASSDTQFLKLDVSGQHTNQISRILANLVEGFALTIGLDDGPVTNYLTLIVIKQAPEIL